MRLFTKTLAMVENDALKVELYPIELKGCRVPFHDSPVPSRHVCHVGQHAIDVEVENIGCYTGDYLLPCLQEVDTRRGKFNQVTSISHKGHWPLLANGQRDDRRSRRINHEPVKEGRRIGIEGAWGDGRGDRSRYGEDIVLLEGDSMTTPDQIRVFQELGHAVEVFHRIGKQGGAGLKLIIEGTLPGDRHHPATPGARAIGLIAMPFTEMTATRGAHTVRATATTRDGATGLQCFHSTVWR